MSSPKVLPIRAMRKPEPSDGLLSLTEVRKRLGTNSLNVYSLASRHHFRTVRVGKVLKYLSGEVDALAARLQAGDPDALRADSMGNFLFGASRNSAA